MFGIVAVILFGSRLPSVARSFGKSIVEFKKGMQDIESEVKAICPGYRSHTDFT
jgi:sec-independent protein translocase protein TatA